MVTITDEQSSIYGNNPYRLVAQDRHVGFDHPPWLSTNQNAALQSSHSGIQNSFSSARSPSSNNLPFITHNQGNTDGMWSSNRNDDGGLFELQYSEPESSPDTTQTSAPQFLQLLEAGSTRAATSAVESSGAIWKWLSIALFVL